jgi:hypothetical protein
MCSLPVGIESPFADRPLELIEREICELSAHMAVSTCHWLRLVAEFDRREGWAEWGVNSCAHWLSWRCSIVLRAAREQVRVARCLGDLALITEEFAAGRLSYSKVRAITRIATPENEEYLVMLAVHATGAQMEKIVSGYRGVLKATTEGAQDAHARRYLYWERDHDGSVLIQARLTPDDGALLIAALEQADQAAQAEREEEEECSAEHLDGEVRRDPPSARRADALTALARAELAYGGSGHAGPDPVELVVHVDVESLGGEVIEERSELANGPSIAPETARRLGCDAGIVRIVERDGKPLSVGRRTRAISPALKRALRDRDPHCRFPSCTHERYLHAHHIQHWARGGPTNLDNLIHLCPHHHRLVHEGGYTLASTAGDAIRFYRPDGRPIPERPPPAPASGPDLAERSRSRGIVVTPDTSQALSAGEPFDRGMAVDGLVEADERKRRADPGSEPT